MSRSWSWTRSELVDQEGAQLLLYLPQLGVVQQTTKYLYFHYKQVALIFKLFASSATTTTKLIAHYIFMVVPVEEMLQPLKISNQMKLQMEHALTQEDCFSTKKVASPFLYCLNNSVSLKLLISSPSSPCSAFRNNLWPLMNITYKSTSNLGLSLMLSFVLYPDTPHRSLSTPTFLFLLPRRHCFS